ncbi:MAG: flagellar motor protein MotA [Hyphomicrobiaceae bacterium]
MAKRELPQLEGPTYQTKFSKPQFHLWTMVIFLTLIGFVAAILFGLIQTAFLANPFLNFLIVSVLAIGIINAFRQIVGLYPEIRWVNNIRIADPGLAVERQPTLLAPMANMLRDRRGVLSLSTATMRSIVDSVGSRLDERRDTSRYLVGLLVFLGLLGTFFGLLETIQSVGKTINSLDVSNADSLNVFQELKSGLEAPLKGMGTAFSSSLFGLSGSLVLGFLDLQTSQAQNRFYNDLEEWLSGITELTPASGGDVSPFLRQAMVDLHRTVVDLGDRLQQAGSSSGEQGEAVRQLAAGIDKLVKQMRDEQKVVREWVDEQASLQNELNAVLRDVAVGTQSQRELSVVLRDLSTMMRDLAVKLPAQRR